MRAAILAFVFGVWLLQQQPTLPPWAWSALLLPVVALCFLLRHRTLALHAALTALALLAGFFYAAAMAQLRLADALPSAWEGQDIQLVGVVASLPQMQERGERFLLDVEQVETPGATVPARISITRYFTGFRDEAHGNAPAMFHAGERWRLIVRLKRPHGSYNPHGFDFEEWALERNIRAAGYIRPGSGSARLSSLVYRPVYLVEYAREMVRNRFHAVLGAKPYTGELLALVIGDDDAISDADWEIFRRTGVTHLMSISGLHVTMVASLAYGLVCAGWRRTERLALRLPARKAAALAGLAVAGLYAVMAGFAVPTQRTFYMLAVLAAALWWGHIAAISLVLAWALMVVVLLDPWAVLAPGFWLSFGAVALLAYAGSHRITAPGWLRGAVQAQWVVTLGLTPLLLALFQQVSLVSPLANAVAIPVISLVVTPLALLGALIPVDAVLLTAHAVMTGCMQLLQWMAAWPLAIWQQHAPPIWTLLAAVAGVLWMLLPRGFPLRWLGSIGLAPLFLVLPALPQPGELRATVLDVGQGLAVAIQTAHHALLYDTGPRYSQDADSGSRIILPYLHAAGVHRLDGLIVSHDDDDHSGGARSVLKGMPVGWLVSPLPPAHPLTALAPQALPCYAGQSWYWDGVQFTALHPDWPSYAVADLKDNDRSCVLKVEGAGGSLLLAGDIERPSEAALLERDRGALDADVLVVPHHGSKTSSTPEFIDAVSPQAAVFTMGYRNRFGHPKPEVVQRYRERGGMLYRSDNDGAVLFEFIPARGIEVRSWRRSAPRYWQERGSGLAETGHAR